MSPTRSLGELEQLVLLAVLRLGDDAYGVSIRAEILQRAGRSVSPGTIYPTLDRLEGKGWVTSRPGAPRPERGGRSRRLFALTPGGLETLRRAWSEMRGLAAGYEELLEGEG